MALKRGNIRRAFTYLESGAVLLVTTNDGERDNVMTISWQMVMDFTPHIAISTGAWNESFGTLLKRRECCICVPTFNSRKTTWVPPLGKMRPLSFTGNALYHAVGFEILRGVSLDSESLVD